MAAHPESLPQTVKLSYSLLGDVLSAQIGDPVPGRLAQLGEAVDLYVSREDASELIGFEIRDFRAGFPSDRRRLGAVLGLEVIKELNALHARVAELARPSSPATREALQEALGSKVTAEAIVPAASGALRAARRTAVEEAWSDAAASATAEAALPALLVAIDEWLELSERWESLRQYARVVPTRRPRKPELHREPTFALALEPGLARLPSGFRSELSAALGAQVRALRQAHKVSASRLAAVAESQFGLDWSVSKVSQIERGSRQLTVEEFIVLPFVLSAVLHRTVELTELLEGTRDRLFLTPSVALSADDISSVLAGRSASVEAPRSLYASQSVSEFQVASPELEPREWLALSPPLRNLEQGFRQLRNRLVHSSEPEAAQLAIMERMLRSYVDQLEPPPSRSPLGAFRTALVSFERAIEAWVASPAAAAERTDAVRDELARWRTSIGRLERQLRR